MQFGATRNTRLSLLSSADMADIHAGLHAVGGDPKNG